MSGWQRPPRSLPATAGSVSGCWPKGIGPFSRISEHNPQIHPDKATLPGPNGQGTPEPDGARIFAPLAFCEAVLSNGPSAR